jgi:phenylacetic acid degradation operon negative regulatory protein
VLETGGELYDATTGAGDDGTPRRVDRLDEPAGTAAVTSDGGTAPRMRPQALLLTFCGAYLLGRDEMVASSSLVEVLSRVGVGEHAARSTLARMTRRGLLARHRVGRRVYFSVTDQAAGVLEEGRRRIWDQEAVNRHWDGRWTLLAFSLPESRRADRHLLRSRLTWAGFGLLQSGLWIAPCPVDVAALVAGLGVADHVRAFRVETLGPGDVDSMIADAWDLDALANRYHRFLTRWDQPTPLRDTTDDLARELLLEAEWLLLARDDPRLPVEHLPAAWPAAHAERVAVRLREAYRPPAERIARDLLDRLPLPSPSDPRHSAVR